MSLVSVIVPVYNTEPYLEACVRSVLGQTCSDFELILVDDGSTDGSAALCEKLCAEDRRIKLLRQENRGVSAARNSAMRVAQGEYLFFLDSDDGIHPRLLQTLLALAKETGAAITRSNSVRIEERALFPAASDEEIQYVYLDSQTAVQAFCFLRRDIRVSNQIGGALVRRSALKVHTFDEEMPSSEDAKFLYQSMSQGADLVLFWPKWYYQRKNSQSLTRRRRPQVYEVRHQFYRDVSDNELKQGRPANASAINQLAVERLLYEYRVDRRSRNRQMVECWREIAKQQVQGPAYPSIPGFLRAKFWLAFHCYPLYQFIGCIYHWLRDRGAHEQAD